MKSTSLVQLNYFGRTTNEITSKYPLLSYNSLVNLRIEFVDSTDIPELN